MASLESLNSELRGEAPQEFCALAESEIRFLTESLRATRKRQQSQLRAAMEAALTHVPALLRAPVKKILLG